MSRYNFTVTKALRERRMLAKQVGPSWDKGYIPKLRVAKDCVHVAAGPKLIAYSLDPLASESPRNQDIVQRTVAAEKTIWTPGIPSLRHRSAHQNAYPQLRRTNAHLDGRRVTSYSPLEDITGFYQLSNGQVVTGNVGGVIQRQRFSAATGLGDISQTAESTALYQHPFMQQIVEISGDSTSTGGTAILSATKDGLASLYHAESPWTQPSTIDVGTRLWTAHLSLSASQPFAAFGGSGNASQALRVFPVMPSGIFANSSAKEQDHVAFGGSQRGRSAVYGIATPPNDMTMSFSNNPGSIVLSAWYDSFARIYDLRTTNLATGNAIPVAEMQDPWSHEALYCCDFVGPGQVVAGSARHGMLHIWDPRMVKKATSRAEITTVNDGSLDTSVQDPHETTVLSRHQGGWTVYTPGQPDSPVYDVKGEGGRIWGVTNRRTFVLAFDTLGASPSDSQARGWDIVPPYLESCKHPRNGHSQNGHWQGQGRSVGRNGDAEERSRDYATCYEHADKSLNPFYSLGANRPNLLSSRLRNR
ncbi:hypothetical protein QFC21_002671 [Naganishia friedmannii]|uniref:Uncharacterized protein n=1 Tax=Naganishia friedmannii TaxID=89922 RepID=A0ACC2VVT6_9TREE|nr:hypothetical protein QFC21_002671 [Naganishia friedmannii]